MSKETKKKQYTKPVVEKYESQSIVSGSGEDCITSSRTLVYTYYH